MPENLNNNISSLEQLENPNYVQLIYELLLGLKPENQNVDLTNYFNKQEINNLLSSIFSTSKKIAGYIVNDFPNAPSLEVKQNDFGALPYLQRDGGNPDGLFLELSPLYNITNEMPPETFNDFYQRSLVLVSDATILNQNFNNINSEALQIHLNTNGDYAKIYFEITLFDSLPQISQQ